MTEPLSADQIFIRKLTDIVLANLADEKLGVKDLVKESGMSLYILSLNFILSKKLDADIYIYGSIPKAGSSILVDAQLIDTRTKEVLKSFNVEELSQAVAGPTNWVNAGRFLVNGKNIATFQWHYHMTENANGVVTAEFYTYNENCK